MKVVNEKVTNIDMNYLLHFSYLLVAKPTVEYLKTDMQYIRNMINTGNSSQVLPTGITAVIGNALLLGYVINSVPYYEILNSNGIYSHNTRIRSGLRDYYCFGEFLRHVMQITELTKEIMSTRFPIVDKGPFDAVQLRMGGRLSDYPLSQQWLSKKSLAVAVRCAETYFNSTNIYVASDSMYAKNYMRENLKNRNVHFVNEKVLFSDTQVMNVDSVSIATYTAVADLYILGNSQSCIMTSGSTFAFAGCAISGNPPITLTSNGDTCVK